MMRYYTVSDERHVKGEAGTRFGNLHGERVDADYVDRYTAIETRRFFINLGGCEEMSKSKTGIITIKSTNPDKTEVRRVKFTPVSGNGDE